MGSTCAVSVGLSHGGVVAEDDSREALASEGVALPTQLIECGSIDFTKSLVAASDHLAMLPAHSAAADLREGTIEALAISVPGLKRDIASGDIPS